MEHTKGEWQTGKRSIACYEREIKELKQQRDDLLATCKYALPLVIGERLKNDIFPPKDDLGKYLAGLFETCEKKLETIIAKAKGE